MYTTIDSLEEAQAYATMLRALPTIFEKAKDCKTPQEMEEVFKPWRKKFPNFLREIDQEAFEAVKRLCNNPEMLTKEQDNFLQYFKLTHGRRIDPSSEQALFDKVGEMRKENLRKLKNIENSYKKKMNLLQKTIDETADLERQIKIIKEQLKFAGLLESEEGPDINKTGLFRRIFDLLSPDETKRIVNAIYERTKLGLWR